MFSCAFLFGSLLFLGFWTLVFFGSWWLLARLLLDGPNLRHFDEPATARATERTEASAEMAEVRALLAKFRDHVGPVWSPGRLGRLRELFDSGLGTQPRNPEELGVEILATDEAGVPAEWVMAPNASPERRLLFIHGGAFYVGSPKSHRPITAQLSRRARACVLAIDYRLMPEHTRMDGIVDCQSAYRFILDHGPPGQTPLDHLWVAGDSAGGNLALMTIAWARDNGLRSASGAIAFSPSTDATLASPTLRQNRRTDLMLGPALGPVVRLPRFLLLWGALLATRINPKNPIVSPLLGNLHGLPPVLVQASENEMLLGDSRRYAHKAAHEGTQAKLQTWPEMVHVWQLFDQILPEAVEALEAVEQFFEETSSSDAPLES